MIAPNWGSEFVPRLSEGAIAIGPGLGQREGWQPAASSPGSTEGIGLDDIIGWHHRMEHISQHG